MTRFLKIDKTKYSLLKNIVEGKGYTINERARMLNLHHKFVKKYITEFRDRGLIKGTKEHRNTHIVLTVEGQRLYDKLLFFQELTTKRMTVVI